MYWTCPICHREFDSYPGMRTPQSGKPWCEPCQDDFDSIGWEDYYEKQREENGN